MLQHNRDKMSNNQPLRDLATNIDRIKTKITTLSEQFQLNKKKSKKQRQSVWP